MPCLSPKDRVSLCRFTFTDGRCCRTPRSSSHPHFCYDHAQKEARACAAETLGKDLAFFFSGDYLSANDLSTALARLIPAVVQGHVKPRAASTIAYLLQTLVQAIRISQDEYINAFGTDGWRKAIRSSVNGNLDYRFPPDPEPGQPESSQCQSAQPQAQASTPASTPVSAPQPTTPQTAPASAPAGSPTNHTTPPPALALSPAAEPPAPANQAAPLASLAVSPAAEPPAPTNQAPTRASQSKILPPATQSTPQSQPNAPNRDPYAAHFDSNYRLRESPKPF